MVVNMLPYKRDMQTLPSSGNSPQPTCSKIRSVYVQESLLDKLNSIEQTVGNIKTEHTMAALNALTNCKLKIIQVIQNQLGQGDSDSLNGPTFIKP